MIESELRFEPSRMIPLLNAFLSLPERLRPVRWAVGEDEAGEDIGDPQKFVANAAGNKLGFFLRGPNSTYDINPAGRELIVCNCYFETGPDAVLEFLLHMARADPIFGFACAPEEIRHRNRIKIKLGVNTIESWVGRNPRKYIPGLYWLTLIPASLAAQHSVPLEELEKHAIEHIELEGQQHLFRFYERPEDWNSAATRSTVSAPGIIDIEKVRPELEGAKTFLEYSDLVAAWS